MTSPDMASDIEVGVLRAAQWLPYLFFGLLAGAVVDRYPRKPILIGTDLARAVMLGLIPVLSLAGLLSVPLLAGIVAVFGVMSLVYDAAHQSFFPRLVPADLLTSAHARMGQSRSLAESTGPLLGGGLVAAVGAQLAILVDAFSYLISGFLLISARSPWLPPENAICSASFGKECAGFTGIRCLGRWRSRITCASPSPV